MAARLGGIGGHDLFHHQPVNQHSLRGKVLLDGRRGMILLQLLDVGRYVQRFEPGQVVEAAGLAPFRESARGLEVGAAGVPVADGGGKGSR